MKNMVMPQTRVGTGCQARRSCCLNAKQKLYLTPSGESETTGSGHLSLERVFHGLFGDGVCLGLVSL